MARPDVFGFEAMAATYLDNLKPEHIRLWAEREHDNRPNRQNRRFSVIHLVHRIRTEKLYKQAGYDNFTDAMRFFGLRPADINPEFQRIYERLLRLGFTPQEFLDLEPYARPTTRTLRYLGVKLHATDDKHEIQDWFCSPQTPEDMEELRATEFLMKKESDLSKTTWSGLAQEWHTEQKTVANTFQHLRRKYGIHKDGRVLSLLAALYVVVRDYPYGQRRGKLSALCDEYQIDAAALDRDLFSTELPAKGARAFIAKADDGTPLHIQFSLAEMRFIRHCLRRLARIQGRFIGVTTNYHDLLLSILVDWQKRMDDEELGE
jgi:hypothetical protein